MSYKNFFLGRFHPLGPAVGMAFSAYMSDDNDDNDDRPKKTGPGFLERFATKILSGPKGSDVESDRRPVMPPSRIEKGEMTADGVGAAWIRRQNGLKPSAPSVTSEADPRDAILNTIAQNVGDYPASLGADTALRVLFAAKGNGIDATAPAFRVAADLAELTKRVKEEGGIGQATPDTVQSLTSAFAFVTASAAPAPVNAGEAAAKLNATLSGLKGPALT